MEGWSEKILNSIDTSKTEILCLLDTVEKQAEEEIEGTEAHEHEEEEHEEEIEYDEHIWSSTENAKTMVKYLANYISKRDEKNKETYQKNTNTYIAEIDKLTEDIQEIVNNRKRDRIVFGDKMPMQYFINQFGLKVSAAFSGCSTETEPSSATIAYLVNKIKEEKIPVVLYIELNDGKIAHTIAEEAGVETAQIQTLHNISKQDFDNGETYVSLMRRNLEVLKKALQ